MAGKQYKVTLTGATPLLLHRDNIQWSERVKTWCKDPENKKISVAGDDRTPAWSWLGCLYHNDKVITVDTECVMSMLRSAGAKCPTGNKTETFKSHTQSGIIIPDLGWPILLKGKPVDVKQFLALKNENDFTKHESLCQNNGFELMVKRAKIQSSKHVRVRPMFNEWVLSGTIFVVDDSLTKDVLKTIFSIAGRMCGLGDWRPGSPHSGRYGCFLAEIK